MYWDFWIGGAALVAIAVGHWLIVGRMMAVSGRFTTLVDRLRFGRSDDVQMSADELMAAMHAATLEEFGPDALESAVTEPAAAPMPAKRRPQAISVHVLFLTSLVLGGMLASAGAHDWHVANTLRSELFSDFFGRDPLRMAGILVFGGVLVGFGTRMAAGCTSGHGLCGVSRLQPGSLVATAAFFGAGIAVSLLIGVIL